MVKKNGISQVSCVHEFKYVSLAAATSLDKVVRCDKCEAVQEIKHDCLNPVLVSGPTLCDAIEAERSDVSLFTNLAKRKIYINRKYVTEYYAQKRTMSIALAVFKYNPDWVDVYIRVPFSGGFVEARVDKAQLTKYMKSISSEDWDFNTRLVMFKNDAVCYAGLFCKSRLSRFVRPGSKFERFLAQLRKNKNFL